MDEMPKYRCHKEVRALKIRKIVARPEPVDPQTGLSMFDLIFEEPGFNSVPKDAAWITQHKAVEGGYYVVYKDGYSSFSPAHAFDDGYTLLNEAKDSSLREQLREAINRCSRENASNTPDFILAQYLLDCLRAYEYATRRSEQHRDRFRDAKAGIL